eukprot:g6406.t1
MTDYSYYQEKVERLVEDLEGTVQKMRGGKMSEREKQELFKKIDSKSDGKLKRLKDVLLQMKKAYLSMGNGADREEAKQLHREFMARQKEIVKQLNWLRTAIESNELMGTERKKDLTSKDIADETVNLAKKNVELADSSVTTAQEILQTGVKINEQLDENNEKLNRIITKAGNIQSQIERASKAVNVLRRRVMTDKLVWVFLLLVVLAIAAILVYVAVNPTQTSFAVPDAAVPPDPEEVTNDVQGRKAAGRLLSFRGN